jgi:hypothetical protein
VSDLTAGYRATEQVGYLALGPILGIPKDDGRALPFRKVVEGAPDTVSLPDVVRRHYLGRLGAFARQVAAFNSEAAQLRRVEVEDRPEQIGVECVGGAEVSKTPDDSQEGLVNEVFGLDPAARQQVCEPNGCRDVASVEIPQPVGWLRLGVGQDLHPRSGHGSVRGQHAIP